MTESILREHMRPVLKLVNSTHARVWHHFYWEYFCLHKNIKPTSACKAHSAVFANPRTPKLTRAEAFRRS